MNKIEFYKDIQGKQPIREYMLSLQKKVANDKNCRILVNKIIAYIDMLAEHGTRAGEPFIKHIEGDLWELRPLNNRIFFFSYVGNRFVLLHHFIKKSQKTPKREIEQAKRNMKDYIQRSDDI